MKEKLKKLEEYVTNLSSQFNFIHHKWFVTHHLKIVEQLVNELCDIYPQANRNICLAMVWLHDLGKIIGNKKLSKDEETKATLAGSKWKLDELGFDSKFIEKILSDLEVLEQKEMTDLSKANIEVKIVSSADGCSHYVGPFMALHWYENPQKPVDDLIGDNQRKVDKDWKCKIVLPEARVAFEDRIEKMREYDPVHREKSKFII